MWRTDCSSCALLAAACLQHRGPGAADPAGGFAQQPPSGDPRASNASHTSSHQGPQPSTPEGGPHAQGTAATGGQEVQVLPADAVSDAELAAWRYGVGDWMLAVREQAGTPAPMAADGNDG